MREYLVLAAILVLLLSGCTSPGAGTQESGENASVPQQNATAQPQPAPAPAAPSAEQIANETARAFALNSSTYAFDGSALELQSVSFGNGTYAFVFTYQSSHSGFGDRSTSAPGLMATEHTLYVTVRDGRVASAVLDGAYDEYAHGWVDIARNFDLTPVDLNLTKQAAIDYVKNSDDYRQRARQGSPVWVDDWLVNKLSDTAYAMPVYFENWSRTYGDYDRETISLKVNRYSVFRINQTLVMKEWVDWYSDPTTDYSKVTTNIPDPKCPQNQSIAANLTMKFCFAPSATHGKPCSKSEDCERGACIRTSMGEFGPPSRCNDYPFGCRYWLYKDTTPLKVCLD